MAAGTPESPSAFLLRLFGGRPTVSGATVTEHTALSWSPMTAGIRLISETLASLPLHVYERQGRNKVIRSDLPLYWVLHDEPNPEMTSFEFRQLLQCHAILWGNAYAQIVRNGRMDVMELWPLNPDRVRPRRLPGGVLVYDVSLPEHSGGGYDGTVTLPADEVLHIPGFLEHGVLGMTLSDRHRDAIGLGLASEQFVGRFFGDGLAPSGILEHPQTLSPEAQKRLRESVERQVKGLDRAHQLLILEEGLKWQAVGIDPQKAQLLELRKFQVTEAARILRVPPHKIGDLEHATFTNIEHQNIEFAADSMLPWIVRWEQRANQSLLLDGQKGRLRIGFDMKGLLRGDLKTRYEAYAIARNWGWMSANDILAAEDENSIGAKGDVYLQPLNMVSAGAPPPPAAPTPAPAVPAPTDQPQRALEAFIERFAERHDALIEQVLATVRALQRPVEPAIVPPAGGAEDGQQRTLALLLDRLGERNDALAQQLVAILWELRRAQPAPPPRELPQFVTVTAPSGRATRFQITPSRETVTISSEAVPALLGPGVPGDL